MRAERALIPREHGATTQLVLVIASALAVSSATPTFLLLAVAATAMFIAHEPAMVLLGKTGAKRLRIRGSDARFFLGAMLALATSAGALWCALASISTCIALAPALIVGSATLVFALRGPQRTLGVELLAALSLAWLSAPLALAGGAPQGTALALACVWSASFGLGTLAARSILVSKRDGGLGVRWARTCGLATLAACTVVLALGWAPHWIAWALLPTALVVTLVTLRAPRPDQMTQTGLLLATAGAAALAALP